MRKETTFSATLQERAKVLRKNMTPWERKLWYLFLKDYSEKFYRQRVIEGYIVDFYCRKAALVLELDGSEHYTEEQKRYDAQRTAALQAKGLRVLRFANTDLDRNFKGVCMAIDEAVKQSM